MKKAFFLIPFLFAIITASSQVPDFSGNWKLNTEKSKLNAEFSFAPIELKITHKGNDLSVERHSEFQGESVTMTDKFTLDGKECINAGFMDTQKKSNAAWSEDKKSLKITSKIVMDDGNEIIITEIYRMDGKNLVIDSSSTSSWGEMAETHVYEKIKILTFFLTSSMLRQYRIIFYIY
jgi:hypothetical protein